MKFKTLRNVTLPILKLKPNGAPAFIRIEGPMFTGKKIDKGSDAQQKKEPATLAHVVNLETGEEMQIICPFLLREQLNESYPGNSYVGKCFRLTVTRDPEKRYNHIGLQEIEPEEDAPQPQTATFEQPDRPVVEPTARQVADAKKGGKKK